MRPEDGTRVGIVTEAQAALLGEIARRCEATGSPSDIDRLMNRAGAILDVDILAFVDDAGLWILKAPHTSAEAVVAEARSYLARDRPDAVATCRLAGRTWTIVQRTESGTRAALLVQADWTLSPQPLIAVAGALARSHSMRRRVSAARVAAPPGQHSRTGRVDRLHYGMLRRLDATTGMTQVAQVILRHAAAAVQARIGALALVPPAIAEPRIVATYGYPLALVEHARVAPGIGVMGTVLESGRPYYGDAATLRAEPRRRYRTQSFVVVPLLSGGSAGGALCVTDREDDASFTREHVDTLRLFAASGVLAIERERAREAAEMSAHAAATDPVTGVFNRRYLQVRLEEELQRSRRHDIPIAVLVIDIDDFKTVNDSFGHLVGDLALKNIADILRHSVRVFDVCARFGGDEFVIVMPGSTAASAARIAERIRARIEEYRSSERALARLRITVSVGLALSSRETSGTDLLERADRALYTAKQSGKNQVRGETTDLTKD